MKKIRRSLSPIKKAANHLANRIVGKKPDFLIIGAQKSGTTSLFDLLVTHPKILMPPNKEVHFFDFQYQNGLSWYYSQLPDKFQSLRRNLIGEATPSYLYHLLSAERIYKTLPNTKLIAILRNPVDRAISQYFFELRQPRIIETKPILDALLAEEERLKVCKEQILTDSSFADPIYWRFAYKSRGRYYEQLLRYEAFMKKDRMLILQSEVFFRQPGKTLNQIAEFLNISAEFDYASFKPSNVGGNKENVPGEVYQYLDSYFRPLNLQLFDFIGQEFDW